MTCERQYTFDGRVRIGRFWLACVVFMLFPDAGIYLFASLSWCAFGLIAPISLITNPPASTCCVCSGCTDPGSGYPVTVIITGYVDDATCNGNLAGNTDCGCSSLNGTYAGTTTTSITQPLGNCMPAIAGTASVSFLQSGAPSAASNQIRFGISNADGNNDSAVAVGVGPNSTNGQAAQGRGDYTISHTDKQINCGVTYGPKTMSVSNPGLGICNGAGPTSITFQFH